MKRLILAGVVAVTGLWFAPPTHALINPTLQPDDLLQRYRQVIVARVVRVDAEARTFELAAVRTLKPDDAEQPAERRWSVVADGDGADAFDRSVEAGDLAAGAAVVAFLGAAERGGRDKLLFYINGWGIGRAAGEGRWRWERGDEQMVGTDGQPVPAMAGVWNGATAQLAELLSDCQAGRGFFPRRAYARFRDDVLVDELDRAVHGVGLVDFDGDGDLDLYACSDGGDRLYLQMEPMVFVNATEYLEMDHASLSCSFADVDGDGRVDLLADGVLYANRMADGKPRLEPTEWLPPEAMDGVKAAAFVELNGDGRPDVLIAREDGGLNAWLHADAEAADGQPLYEHATAKLGLDRADRGAEDVGFFTVGDWNDDGRADLFFAAGPGHLLVQGESGVFEPVAHDIAFSFTAGPQREAGMTGAGAFLPMLGTGRLDLIVPTESGWVVVANEAGKPRDVTEFGNEISEGSYLHFACVADDWNLDGRDDFYTVARGENGQNRYIINRGYGSFMLATVNRAFDRMFHGPAHQRGGWGVATGDINGDGQPDLLIGNERGELMICLNDTLAVRKRGGQLLQDERVLAGVQLIAVDLGEQRGVVGADVRLLDAGGRVVARRSVGANIASGCQSSRAFTLAVREAGRYELVVRFADGLVARQAADLNAGGHEVAPLRIAPVRP